MWPFQEKIRMSLHHKIDRWGNCLNSFSLAINWAAIYNQPSRSNIAANYHHQQFCLVFLAGCVVKIWLLLQVHCMHVSFVSTPSKPNSGTPYAWSTMQKLKMCHQLNRNDVMIWEWLQRITKMIPAGGKKTLLPSITVRKVEEPLWWMFITI